MAEKSGAAKKRQDVKSDYWPNEDSWTGEGEVGWFKASRTLPLFLSLLNEKSISGNNDPRSTYIELLSRQMGEGIVEMGHERDHAFAAGYSSTRGVRTRVSVLFSEEIHRAKGNVKPRGLLLAVVPILECSDLIVPTDENGSVPEACRLTTFIRDGDHH